MTAPGLSLVALRRTFPGGPRVLDGVDLDVPSGGCVALLGPSGAGKSTVLRTAAGLDSADAGRVLVAGRDMAGVPTERRRTALVFQRPRLFPHLRVLDNVAFGLQVTGTPRGQARRTATSFLDLVGAGDLANRRPASLSGGQEQRVALARALAVRPDVLLLDEPFSALDPGVRAEMQQLLAEMRAAVEPTVLIVTHDRLEASVVADTVAVLLDGRVAQHDRADVLHARPLSLQISRFLGGLNEVPGVLGGAADGAGDGAVHVSAIGRLAMPAGSHVGGPATLVVRQEAVRLVTPGAADTVSGTVRRVTLHGARRLVEVGTAAGPLFAEVPPGTAAHAGDAVGLELPVEQRWAVPPQTGLPEVVSLEESLQ